MMNTEDIVGTLQAVKLVEYYEGQRAIDMRFIHYMKMGSRGVVRDPSRIVWTAHTAGAVVVVLPWAGGGAGKGRRRQCQ